MSFIGGLCRDKEPEVPRNSVNNNSIAEPDGMFPFFYFCHFLFFFFFFLRDKAKTKKI